MLVLWITWLSPPTSAVSSLRGACRGAAQGTINQGAQGEGVRRPCVATQVCQQSARGVKTATPPHIRSSPSTGEHPHGLRLRSPEVRSAVERPIATWRSSHDLILRSTASARDPLRRLGRAAVAGVARAVSEAVRRDHGAGAACSGNAWNVLRGASAAGGRDRGAVPLHRAGTARRGRRVRGGRADRAGAAGHGARGVGGGASCRGAGSGRDDARGALAII